MMTLIRDSQAPLRRIALVFLATFAVAALSGCGIFSPDESDDGGGGGDETFPPAYVVDGAAGREQLIDNLEQAYERQLIEEYDKLLAETYIFRIDPSELDAVGQLEFSRAEDYDSTTDMFNGQKGRERILDSEGKWTGEYLEVPAVQTIRLRLDAATGSNWILVSGGEFDGSWQKTYNVEMTVTYSGDPKIDQISGAQVFYVVPGTITVNGVEIQVWQLRAWEDQGIAS